MEAPADLVARTGDGKRHPIAARGVSLPREVRLVFATERPGQRELGLDLHEGDREEPFARATFALPPGLPANCWIPVFVRVSAAGALSAEARENLRRVRVDASFEALGEGSYTV